MHSMPTPRATPKSWFTLLALIVTLSFSASGESVNESTSSSKADQRVDDAEVGSESGDEQVQFDRAAPPQTFGWIEKVILSPELRWKLDAKLDTGADTSSLDARNMRRVKYKGKSYVRFSIRDPESGDMISLRRPYVRSVRIRRHNGDHQRRRVVLMTVCLGNAQRTIEVTLTDREVFDYPMLLGRSALAGLAIVDPMKTYTSDPVCKKITSDENDSTDPEARKDQPIESGSANTGH